MLKFINYKTSIARDICEYRRKRAGHMDFSSIDSGKWDRL